MPGLHSQESDNNGLLKLLYAAECLNDSDLKLRCKSDWEPTRPYSRSHHMSESKIMKERKSLGSRCSHNELEKRRRGYLKQCMEQLKERLDFKNETSRITTLSVLKKAKNEILNSHEEITKYEDLIKKEKLRTQILSKRKFQCKKRIEERNSRRTLTWRERNRNFSECSVTTTSSEESELDFYSQKSLGSRSGNQSLFYGAIPQRSLTPQQNRQSMLPPRKHLASISEAGSNLDHINGSESIGCQRLAVSGKMLRPMVSINTNISGQCSSLSSAGTSPSPLKATTTTDLFMDGSSSDSGYEEISSLTPPGTSECLSPLDLSGNSAGSTPAKSVNIYVSSNGLNHSLNPRHSSIAKANQLIHQQAASAVLQGTLISGNGAGVSYWNSIGGTVF